MSSLAPFNFDPSSRVMLIAPHPDDETLACGTVLQGASRAGADINVVYETDGENNPWPQRAFERKWKITESDRARWGEVRRAEARAALAALGVRPSALNFLGLPDQGLTNLLMTGCRPVIERFQNLVADWRPTHLFVPSIADTHPDHNALGVILRFALLSRSALGDKVAVWSFAVHGESAMFAARAISVEATAADQQAKLEAIACHKTQLRLSRRRFIRYARRSERFVRLTSPEIAEADTCFAVASRRAHVLTLHLRPQFRFFAPSEPRLLMVGSNAGGEVVSAAMRVPLRSARMTSLVLPTAAFATDQPLYLKLDRRRLFFDEAGWSEIPPIARVRGGARPVTVLSSDTAVVR